MYYMAVMWLLVLSAILFTEYYHSFSLGGKTQIYADLVADGAAFIGNNGWGIDTKEAKKAEKKLIKYNEDNFEDIEIVTLKFSNTDEDDNVKKKSSKKDGYNTVTASAQLDSTMLSGTQTLSTSKSATTKITYSGGLKIVLEAWKHTYQYRKSSAGQTAYVWGGGHGIDSDSDAWENYADCSGFVSGVFRKCGYDVPSWACTWNMETMGELVGTGYSALEDARPGDIILYWYNTASTSAHVGIYAGKYNGKHYQIHCSGGQINTYINPGRGSSKGAILAGITSASKIMVRRIVDADANAYETPEVKISGLTENQTIMYLTMSSLGYKDKTIAGMMGNWACEGVNSPIVREGHGNPNDPFNTNYAKQIEAGKISMESFVYEGKGRMSHNGSEGYGIAQWTTTNWEDPFHDRKAELWKYTNGNVTSLTMQLGFVQKELENGIWNQISAKDAPAQYSAANYKKFLNATDPGEAALMFLTHYEGIWDDSAARRVASAKFIYNKIKAYNAK